MIKPFVKFRSRSNEELAYSILDAEGFILPARGQVVGFPIPDGFYCGKVEEIAHEFDKEHNQIITIWIEVIV